MTSKTTIKLTKFSGRRSEVYRIVDENGSFKHNQKVADGQIEN